MIRLSRIYSDDKSPQQDYDKAIYWMSRAVNSGINWAIPEFLDLLLRKGDDESLSLFFDLANQYASKGNSAVMAKLSDVYLAGSVVNRDLIQATKWMEMAYKTDHRWLNKYLHVVKYSFFESMQKQDYNSSQIILNPLDPENAQILNTNNDIIACQIQYRYAVLQQKQSLLCNFYQISSLYKRYKMNGGSKSIVDILKPFNNQSYDIKKECELFIRQTIFDSYFNESLDLLSDVANPLLKYNRKFFLQHEDAINNDLLKINIKRKDCISFLTLCNVNTKILNSKTKTIKKNDDPLSAKLNQLLLKCTILEQLYVLLYDNYFKLDSINTIADSIKIDAPKFDETNLSSKILHLNDIANSFNDFKKKKLQELLDNEVTVAITGLNIDSNKLDYYCDFIANWNH